MQPTIIDIDRSIVDSEVLMGILERKLVEKKVDKVWYGDSDNENCVLKSKVQLLNESYAMLLKMREHYIIHEVPIASNRPRMGKYIKLYKRVFRKLTRWIFSYYIEQQNQFNTDTINAIDSLIELNKKMVEDYSNGD